MSLPDIRLQVAALALFDEQNFTRAAERLGITQPALSKRIVELESHLGFVVFQRGRRRVDLTDAGQTFIKGCRDANSILERSIRQAKATHAEVTPVVTVGYSPYADPTLVTALLGIHLPLFPNLRLRIESMFAPELAHAVLSSELDLALIANPVENPRLTQVQIASHPICAIMPSDHPSAVKPQVEVADFSGSGWVLWVRKSNPAIYEKFMDEARSANVSPVELHHYLSPQESLQLITENFGVAFAAKGIAEQLKGLEICVRPLSHPSLEVTTFLVLRADEGSRLVNDFCRTFLRKVVPQIREQLNPRS